MWSAWIRSVGFFGAVGLLAAACNASIDGPTRADDEPGFRRLDNGNAGPVFNNGPGAGGIAVPNASGSSTGGGMTATATVGATTVTSGGGMTATATVGATTVTSGGGMTATATVGAGAGGAGGTGTGIVKMPLPDGMPCTAGIDCISGSCVDEVCCESACSATCFACSAAKKGGGGGGGDGSCGPIGGGGDPDNECDEQPICGNTGLCSGFGSCAKATAGTTCATCGAEGYALPATCDGSGTCGMPPQKSCAFFQCNDGECLTACSSDAQCITGAFCNEFGVCGPKQNNGGACTAGVNGCKSGFCADGVCCNALCDGACVACTAALKLTGADGVCGNITAGKDPQSECVDPGPQSPCEAPGFCNGNGACAPKLVANTLCGNASCNIVTSVATEPSLCDGNGKCNPGATHNCPAMCLGTVCKTPCSVNSDCPNAEYCAMPNCAPKKPLGAACSLGAECAVGNCVEGVCCDSPCSGGGCQTCLLSKGASTEGTCTALNGVAPMNACPGGDACKDKLCSGGACAYPEKICPPSAVCTEPRTCDLATGACTPPKAITCPTAPACEIAGKCDAITGVCAPSSVACPVASDACHVAATCDSKTGKCPAETVKKCEGDGLAVCDTLVCDLSLQGACVVRSKLDGAKCTSAKVDGICVAGSCFTIAGSNGNGGAGGVASTGNATGANGATGATGATGAGGGAGGSGGFHFVGGACTIVDGVNIGDGRLAGLLFGLLLAARRRSRRAPSPCLRGSRDA